jgi:alpha-L-rhamnosidase
MNRRAFLKSSALSTLVLGNAAPAVMGQPIKLGPLHVSEGSWPMDHRPTMPDLNPARWLWYPSERCLQNTFVLFRREFESKAKPRRASGWISADSRYLLEVNGQRIQWGPAPADPRWPEADPVDLSSALRAGRNVIGATVLFYGQGDGTWPVGKPGFLFWLEIEHEDGRMETLVSDGSWKACLARSWKPGQYKRWYLRALQEEFDARLYPDGWTTPQFVEDGNWRPAMTLTGSPNKPAIATSFHE